MKIVEGQQAYSVKTAEFLERKNAAERMQQAVKNATEQKPMEQKLEITGDTLELSEEGKSYAMDSMEAEETNDPIKENVKETSKCMEIARRIAAGGKVPASDAQRLMQYNPQLYMASVNAATSKQNEKKQYEALFEENKKVENGQHNSDKPPELSDDMKEKLKELNSSANIC